MVPTPVRPLDRSMARAVAWNAAARWLSQLLSWASTIAVARLLTPYDYGLIGMGALYLELAMLISQAGIGDTIITLRDLTHQQIAELNTISLILGVGLVGLSCALALPIAGFFSAPPLFAVLVASSGMFLFNAFQVVPRALLQRELRFKLLASIDTLRALFQIGVTLLFAFLKFRYWSLVISYVCGSALASSLTCYRRPHEFARPKLSHLRAELKYSFQVLLSRVAWYAYENADFGVAGRVLGEVPLGNYTVAWTISSAPVEKITNLVTGVTPAYFSAVQGHRAELRRYLLRLTELLSFVTIPVSVGLALSADSVVAVLLGPKWYGVIGPLRLLGVFVAARSITTILPNLLTAIGDAGFVMWATVSFAIVMPIAFLVGSRWGTTGIAAAWVFACPVIVAPMYGRVFKKIELPIREYLVTILPAVNGSIVMTAVVLLVRSVVRPRSTSPLTLIFIVLLGILSYTGALFVFHRKRVFRLIQTIGKMLGKEPPDASSANEAATGVVE